MRIISDHKDKFIAMAVILFLLASAGFEHISYALEAVPDWLGIDIK